MKKVFATLFAALCLLSCKDTNIGPKNYSHADKVYCEFLSVDAYKEEIHFDGVSEQGKTISYIMGLSLKKYGNNFINQNRIVDESATGKEKKLAEALTLFNFTYDTGVDTHLIMLYGGISGPVKVYADNEVNGRQAGEDISDLFVIYTKGVVHYPEMTLTVANQTSGDQEEAETEYSKMKFCDYFSDGNVPFGVDNETTYLSAIEGYSYLIDGSVNVHFEIPITGIALDGQEKSKVLTGVIPPQR